MSKKIIKKVSEAEQSDIGQVVDDIKIEEPKQLTIHDKYRDVLNKLSSGTIRLKFNELREIQVWVQQKTDRTFGVDPNCTSCVISLLNKFKSLE